ncbi:MAG: hypothetical protein DMG65_12620 [Candidatus Angelobacter sp. Gp1-AA117]|nr:MAG: hypothetical protein DMG65_12620 [Candidatus Angelobacter sp. Gp1-AA117]
MATNQLTKALKRKAEERKLYPIVRQWLTTRFSCFTTASDKGLAFSRIDVVGIRDVGGDFSGEIETITVEVKRGGYPFAKACGQTLGYKAYGNRVYLADVRKGGFNDDELHIASHLGIGLVAIWKRECTEVLSSPFYQPITKLNLALLYRLRLARCQFCGSYFQTGTAEKRRGNITRRNILSAAESDKGLVFFNVELAERKLDIGMRLSMEGRNFERRFICPTCVRLLAQLSKL